MHQLITSLPTVRKSLATLMVVMLAFSIISVSVPGAVYAQEAPITDITDTPTLGCTLVADTDTITAGDGATLTLASTGAASASIDEDVGAVDLNGETIVTPSDTTTYTATVTAGDASATCTATVTVNPADTSGDETPTLPHFVEVDENACVAVSDEDTLADGVASVPTFEHDAWTHDLDGDHGATWIWNAADADQSSLPETVTFTKTMSLTDVPSSATLELASDNEYTVTVNGVAPSCDGSQSNNFSNVETCSVSNLVAGDNALVFTVTNDATDSPAEPHDNPSGLIYKLTADGAQCGQPEVPQSCMLVSDSMTQEDGHDSAEESFYHSSWTHDLDGDGAKWIWGEDGVTDTVNASTEVFTRTFHVDGTPSAATLTFAADNGYQVRVNGTLVGGDHINDEHNYENTTTLDILSALDPNADNTLEVTVQNLAMDGGTSETNPAGLDYRLDIADSSCSDVHDTPKKTATIKLCKVDEEGNPLAGWQLTLRKNNAIGQVHVSATDGAGVEQTIPDVGPGDYAVRAMGTYIYRPGDAIASTSDAAYSLRDPSDSVYGGPYAPWVRENDFPAPYQGWLGVMINDSYTDWGSIFNPNPTHKYWTALHLGATTDLNFNILDDEYGDNSGSLKVTVFKGYTGVTGEDGCVSFDNVPYGKYQFREVWKPGWTRVSDNRHVTVNAGHTTFTVVNTQDGDEENAGTITVVKHTVGGEGSFNFHVDEQEGDDDSDFPLSTIGIDGDTVSHQVVVNADTPYDVTEDLVDGWDSTVDCVYDEESIGSPLPPPTIGETVSVEDGDNVTCTFTNTKRDDSDDTGALIVKKEIVNNDEGTVTDPSVFSFEVDGGSSTAFDADGENEIGVTAGSHTVSEVAADGYTPSYSGDCDENGNVTVPASGSATCIVTNDDNTPEVTAKPEHDHSGGSGNGGESGGSVLGAETDVPAGCELLITTYMKQGDAPDASQVAALQNFLNGEMGSGLPVTGFFGPLTDAAVRAFQLKYDSEVLAPWVPFGFADTPTGYVFKLTRWKINSIHCAPIVYPMPELP